MKLLLSWILLSSLATIVIALNFHKITPVGEHRAKTIISSTELLLLNRLLQEEKVTKETLHSLINKRRGNWKQDVIRSQIESLPIAIISIYLLFVNSLNIVFILVYTCYARSKHREKT